MTDERFFKDLMRPVRMLGPEGMKVYKAMRGSKDPLSLYDLAATAKVLVRTTDRNLRILRSWGYVAIATKVCRDGVYTRLYKMAEDAPKDKPVLRGSYAYQRVRRYLSKRAAAFNPFDAKYGDMGEQTGVSYSAFRVAVANLESEGFVRTELRFMVDPVTGQTTNRRIHTRFWVLGVPFVGPGASIPPPPPRAERPGYAPAWRQGDEHETAGNCCRECGRPF